MVVRIRDSRVPARSGRAGLVVNEAHRHRRHVFRADGMRSTATAQQPSVASRSMADGSTTTERWLIYALALAGTSFAVSIALAFVGPALTGFWLLLAVASGFCVSAALRGASSGSGAQRAAAAVTLVGCVLLGLFGAFFVLFTIGYSGSGGG